MLLTRECDYGIRTIRALGGGEKRTVQAICEEELIPGQYAYKILKKLERAGFVVSIRGREGGYQLTRSLSEITLYDIIIAIDDKLTINECLKEGKDCARNPDDGPCVVHRELDRIQTLMIAEMKRNTVLELVKNTN